MKSRLLGSIFGACVGDALGVPVEFRSRDYLRSNPVVDMFGYGTHNQPVGTWSDDTSMMLCTLESLCGAYDLDDIASNLVRWYADATWTPHGTVFDIGETTRVALELLRRGSVSPRESGVPREEANGNGALVRMLPLAWTLVASSPETIVQRAWEVTAITHAHPRAMLASWLYIAFAHHLIRGLPLGESYRRLQADAARMYPEHPEMSHFARILDGGLVETGVDEIESTGYCVHSLEAALWSLLRSGSFREAVLTAVNLGGDTDSIGAIVGGLAGIHYGAATIPTDWLRALPRSREIMQQALEFYRVLVLSLR